MITKTNFKGVRGLQILKSAPIALLLLQSKVALAQTTAKPSEGVSILEILGYVGMILGVILLAWIIGSAQSKGKSRSASADSEVAHRPHRHFEHPHDPHFRKLRKKTS